MSDLGNLPGIDVEAGLKITMNNEGLYRRLLVKFLENHSDFEAEFRSAQESGDIEARERVAHSLKGVAGNLCMPDLYHAAVELDAACKENSADVEVSLQKTVEKLHVVLEGLAGFST